MRAVALAPLLICANDDPLTTSPCHYLYQAVWIVGIFYLVRLRIKVTRFRLHAYLPGHFRNFSYLFGQAK